MSRAEVEIDQGPANVAARTLSKLVYRYGRSVDLRLLDGNDDVWVGPARFTGVELPPQHPEEVLITLAFGRRLNLNELRRLRLVGNAA